MLPALMFLAALGQAAAPATAEPALARIRSALAADPPRIETAAATDSDRPVFRLEITRKAPRPLWADPFPVPSYIRPSAPLSHYEFLQQVTPDEFRSSVLYPGAPTTPFGGVGIAVPVIPIYQAVAGGIRAAAKRQRERAARAEVQQALDELDQARRAAGLSGTTVPRR